MKKYYQARFSYEYELLNQNKVYEKYTTGKNLFKWLLRLRLLIKLDGNSAIISYTEIVTFDSTGKEIESEPF